MPAQKQHYKSEITCPYCGWKPSYSLEHFRGDEGDGSEHEMECGGCEKMFKVTMNVEVTYSTDPVEDPKAEVAVAPKK